MIPLDHPPVYIFQGEENTVNEWLSSIPYIHWPKRAYKQPFCVVIQGNQCSTAV